MGSTVHFAVLSDTHLAPADAVDYRWNNLVRVSSSGPLLDAALASITAAGHDKVMVLGDVSDRGDRASIGTVLRAVSRAGLRCWAVPGNHDVQQSPEAFAAAAAAAGGDLRPEGFLSPGTPSAGPGSTPPAGTEIALHAPDLAVEGGRWYATDLPDLTRPRARLLLWATHFPVLSQRERLKDAGLRDPGDLANLDEITPRLVGSAAAVLVLHGHLHTGVVDRRGPVLQIGVPAAVEWPHAWTDVSIEVTGGEVAVRTALVPIPGTWSTPLVDTVLDGREQHWVYGGGRWQRQADPS